MLRTLKSVLPTQPLVTVIIPTYDSEKTIKQCLQSLKGQTYLNTETLVVDAYSGDETFELSKQLASEVLLLDGERSKAKNYAAKRARGQFIFFLDSDMKLGAKTIEKCVKLCEESGVDGVILPERNVECGRFGECRKIEKDLLSTTNTLLDIPRFLRRDVFLTLGGFDEELVCGEDFDFFQKLLSSGYRVAKTSCEIEHLEGSPSLYDIAAKSYGYGKTFPSLLAKRSNAVRRYASFRLTTVNKIGGRIRNPTMLLYFTTMKIVEYTSGLLAMSASIMGRSTIAKLLKKSVAETGKNKRTLLSLMFFLSISFMIFRNFFLTTGAPAGNDLYGWVSREYIFARDWRWTFIWRPYSFGFVEGINLIDPFLMITYLPFQNPVMAIEAFIFLSFLLAGFSMYAFAYRYTKNSIASLAATMIYTLNQWFFSQITEGHVDIMFSYAFAPLLFLLVDRALTRGNVRNMMFSAMALAIFATGFHANAIVIYGLFLILFLAVYLLFPNCGGRITKRGKSLMKFLVICGAITALLAAFYTLPFFMNVRARFLSGDYNYAIEEAESFSAPNIVDAFTLGATEEGGYINLVNVRQGLGLPDFPVQTFLLIVFLISYSAIIFRRDRHTIFFLVASLVSIFISKGTNPPFGSFFKWAWFNIPHFAVFRRPNRWEMMTAFSTAFFVALFVSLALNYLKRTPAEKETFDVKTVDFEHKEVRDFHVSIDILSRLSRSLKKAMRLVTVALLIALLLSGLISSWFFFWNGVITYRIPEGQTDPLKWIATQPGDYKIVTVNKSPSEWEDGALAETDFAFTRMLTPVGWAHDIGFDSSFIHDKPVLQDGGWELSSRSFVDYLRRGLVGSNETDDFLKILGSFGYKYVVVPSYGSEKVRTFLLNQVGGHVVYDESDSLIIENDYFNPLFFSPANYVLALGGLDLFPLMEDVDSFKLDETALVYVDQNNMPPFSGGSLWPPTAMVFASGCDFLSVISPVIENSGTLILGSSYATPSWDTTGYWVRSSFWRDRGERALGKDTLTTRGKCKVTMPLWVETDGEYEVWIRIGFGPDRGELSVYVDGELLGRVNPEADYWTNLKWIRITDLNLTHGSHELSLHNNGDGYNDVDAVSIVRKSVFQARLDEYLRELGSLDSRVMYYLQPVDFLRNTVAQRWTIDSRIYEGKLIVGENMLTNISFEATPNASSAQRFPNEELEPRLATDGDQNSGWASGPFEDLPQWLELSWASRHEIVGIKVLFDNAYAENYHIQTWNGHSNKWETQVNVEENDANTCTHFFEKPVSTSKLRICITKCSILQFVSILEFETYEKSVTNSIELFSPRNETYQCFIRATSFSDTGKLYLKLDDNISEVSVSRDNVSLQWYDAGVFSLHAAENNISIGVLGKVGISQLLLCSLRENESRLQLGELFGSKTSKPTIRYTRENPCKYKLSISAEEPFLLVFSESFNPLWKVFIEDQEISPFPVYSFLNGFFVNKTGCFEATVYFTGQVYVDIGLRIASVGFLVALVLAMTPLGVFKKIGRKQRCLKRNR